jgi:hypothetical protein
MNIIEKLKNLGAKFDDQTFNNKDVNFTITKDMAYHGSYIFSLKYNCVPSKARMLYKLTRCDDIIKYLIQNNFVVSNVDLTYERNTRENIHFSNHEKRIMLDVNLSGNEDFPVAVSVSDVDVNDNKESVIGSIDVCFDANVDTNLVFELIEKFSDHSVKDTKGKILLFEKNEYNEIVLTPHKVKGFDLSLEDNYNDDFEKTHRKIENWINDFSIPNNKLVLLHGDPGSGKTNYIKYLLNRDDGLKKIYIPPYFVQSMADPAFFPVIRREKDSLLIIEDAEKVLINREDSSDNSIISILLNICDGIMADVLNFKIIATFNTDEDKIDPALKRRGRMFLKHKFGPLNKEKTERLYRKLYDHTPPKEEMTLSEIYNDENDFSPKKEKRVMGFFHNQ